MNEYLTVDMLSEIEELVENLHSSFVSKFNIEETNLREIEKNDSFSNKIIYFDFPRESDKLITTEANKYEKLIELDTNYYISQSYSSNGNKYVSFFYKNATNTAFTNWYLYNKYISENNPRISYLRYKFPKHYGKVNNIKKNNITSYIKIKNDETKPLEFIKKEWNVNEIVYLQDINRIEEGIEEIANCFFKPIEYISKKWTETGYYNSNNIDYGLEQKSISKDDFNRWKRNVEILKENFDKYLNIWNLESQLIWNKEIDEIWEEYDGKSEF